MFIRFLIKNGFLTLFRVKHIIIHEEKVRFLQFLFIHEAACSSIRSTRIMQLVWATIKCAICVNCRNKMNAGLFYQNH